MQLESRAKAVELVTSVVRELSEELGYENLGQADGNTPLFGGEQGIDSLSVVRIVAEVERVAERRFGRRIVLADDRAMSMRHSPFRTVTTLADLLADRLGE